MKSLHPCKGCGNVIPADIEWCGGCGRSPAEIALADAIRQHLTDDEVVERAGFATWVAQLDGLGHHASDAEYRFGWDHLPQSHRAAWVDRARRILTAVIMDAHEYPHDNPYRRPAPETGTPHA